MCHNIYMGARKEMTCDNCGKTGARIRKVAKTYGKGKDIWVIENVPIVTCPHCGESYLEAETLHEIERIKLHKKSFAVKRSVPVVEFA
jgi:YgiT-type zinc finger domain-containing protein